MEGWGGVDDLFSHAERYPYSPGYQRRETSREAAEAMKPRAKVIRDKVYDAIVAAGADGLTAHEAAAVVEICKEAVQPRTSELTSDGKIKDSGQRRENASGKRAIVWVAV